MKQLYSFKTWHSLISMLFVMMCCLPETVAAQVSFSDDFNYPAGNLHEQGGWVRYGKNAEDPIQVLDKITGTILGVQSAFGTTSAMALGADLGTVVSKGNTVTPVEATLAQLKANPTSYIQQLVKVKNLKFKDVAEGAIFAEGMAQPVVTDGAEEAKVRIFKGTTLIGKSIPAADITLTGLFTSSKTLIIGPRGIEDIAEQQPVGEPAITISPEKIEQTAG